MVSIFNTHMAMGTQDDGHLVPLTSSRQAASHGSAATLMGMIEDTSVEFIGQDTDFSQVLGDANTSQDAKLNHGNDASWDFSQLQIPDYGLNPGSGEYLYFGEGPPMLEAGITPGFFDTGKVKDNTAPDTGGNETWNDALPRAGSFNDDPFFDTLLTLPYTYDLRPGFRDPNQTTTWLDRDESGNYDPVARAPRATRRKRKAHNDSPDEDDDESSVEQDSSAEVHQRHMRFRAMSELAARQNGASYVLTLKLNSGQARTLLATGVDNWPFEGHRGSNTSLDSRNDIFSSSDSKAYKLRSRASGHIIPSDSVTRRPDLTGQPVARGCWSCFALGLECSLLHDGTTWPCHACEHDSNDCELITPATVKKSCEGCKRRKTQCSYTNSSDHTMPCIPCRDSGFSCIAGPVKAAIRQRISYDHPAVSQPRPLQCVNCLEMGQECSMATAPLSQPCSHCSELGRPCMSAREETPQYESGSEEKRHRRSRPKKKQARKRKQKKRIREAAVAKQSGRSDEEENSPSPSVPLRPRTMITKLSHPISFNHNDLIEGSRCHFCELLTYPIAGLGARTVSIVSTPHGFYEMSSDDNDDVQQRTRLCMTHTMYYVLVFFCNPHNMQLIPNTTTGGYTAAFERLRQGSPSSTDMWCSICPLLADSECTATHENLAHQDGCGLRLCQWCREALVDMHEGDMQAYLAAPGMGGEGTAEKPFGLRADVELLRHDGPLAVHLAGIAQQSGGLGDG